ncbi:unnamed protein product [Absidia cylindrospora]
MTTLFISTAEHHEHVYHEENDSNEKIIQSPASSTITTSKSHQLIEQQGLNERADDEKEETSWIAWVLVLVVISINTASAMMWMTASSLPTAAVSYFNVTLTEINWLSNLSAILNTVFSLPSAWSYERFGLKKSIIISASFNMVGCWIRCIAIIVPSEKKYAMMMLGQFIASFGGPLIYNIAAKLVAVWFAPKDRSIANMLISIQLGMALAPLILPQMVKTADDMPRTLIILAGISTVVTIPPFFLPARPARPPSKSALEERMNFLDGLKQLIKNPAFLWIVLLCAVNMGMVYSVSVLIIEAILPLGYSDQDAGVCASLLIFGGFAGGYLTGYWAGKTSQYLMIIKMFVPLVIFSYVVFFFQIIPNAFGAVAIACIVNGFFSYGIFPVMLEFCSEVTYPVPESISSCVVWSVITAFMLIFSVMIDSLRSSPDANPPNNMNNSMIAMIVVVAVGLLPAFWLKGDLKRLAIDDNKQKESENRKNEHQMVTSSQA